MGSVDGGGAGWGGGGGCTYLIFDALNILTLTFDSKVK